MLIVISAPSGGGKTTVINEIFHSCGDIEFSVSATTREKRNYEVNGKDYYFISKDEFKDLITRDEFIEWEEVHNNFYGSLKKEVENKSRNGKNLIFDVDVKGALNIKKMYPEAVTIFIESPLYSIRKRLENRGTETNEQINKRMERVEMEMEERHKFDYIVSNDNGEDGLQKAVKKILNIINKYKGNKNVN